MESIFWQIAIVLIGAVAAGSWAFFLTSRKDNVDAHNRIRDRVLQLETTAIREHNVKQLINDSLNPLALGIEDLKTMMGCIQRNVMDIQLDMAKKEGRDQAIAEAEKHKRTEGFVP